MLHDNSWTISLIAVLLLTFMSHIYGSRQSTWTHSACRK